MEFCPACTLRKALTGGVESGESSSEDILKLIPEQATQELSIMNYRSAKLGISGEVAGDDDFVDVHNGDLGWLVSTRLKNGVTLCLHSADKGQRKVPLSVESPSMYEFYLCMGQPVIAITGTISGFSFKRSKWQVVLLQGANRWLLLGYGFL
jgi:hypothetical protein